MRKLYIGGAAIAVLLTAPHFAFAKEFSSSGEYHGGFAIGPLGQCLDPRGCAQHKDIYGNYGSASYGQSCQTVRERVVTPKGNVVYRHHRACY